MIQSVQKSLDEHARVMELIDPATKQWKIDLIVATFEKVES